MSSLVEPLGGKSSVKFESKYKNVLLRKYLRKWHCIIVAILFQLHCVKRKTNITSQCKNEINSFAFKNALKNAVCKLVVIFTKPQCVMRWTSFDFIGMLFIFMRCCRYKYDLFYWFLMRNSYILWDAISQKWDVVQIWLPSHVLWVLL